MGSNLHSDGLDRSRVVAWIKRDLYTADYIMQMAIGNRCSE